MLPHYNLYFSESSGELEDLILAIHKYFPIGFDKKNETFSGYKKLVEIASQKLTSYCNEGMQKELMLLEDESALLFPNCSIMNEIVHQFPNYSIAITISENETDEITLRSVLYLKISLLVNYYTIYFEETISYKNEDFMISPPIRHVTISQGSKLYPSKKIPVRQLMSLVEKAFPTYRFAEPGLLFNTKVKSGFPMQHQDIPWDYCIFDFLFDTKYILIKNLRFVLTAAP